MKLFKSFALVVAMAALFVAPAFATQPVRTTLSAAIGTIQSGQIGLISLTSETGMVVSTAQAQTFLLVDQELMRIVAFPTTTSAQVVRGYGATRVHAHLNGAEVIYGVTANFNSNSATVGGNPGAVFLFGASHPVGACSRALNPILPVINPSPGPDQGFYDCLGGQWQQQTMLDSGVGGPLASVCSVKTAPVALVSVGVNTIPGTAGNFYFTTFFNPTTRKVTNIKAIFGVTVGSAAGFQMGIYEWNTVTSGGLLFNTTTAGSTIGTASVYSSVAVGTAGYLTGPATYMFYVQAGGTTDGVNLLPQTGDIYTTLRAGTFGTLPAGVVAATASNATVGVPACFN